MTSFLELRERLKAFYGRYTTVLTIVLKFLLSFAIFWSINAAIGFSKAAANPFTVIILSLLSSILPLRATAVFAGALIVFQAFAVGYDAGAVALALLLVLLICFLRFVPDDTLILLFVPMAMACGAPEAVPMCFGLKRRPVSILSVGSGVVVYYLIHSLHQNGSKIAALSLSDYTQRLSLLTGGIFGSREMILHLLTLSAVMILVYAVRKLSFDHSWIVAIFMGAILYAVMMILGSIVLAIPFNLVVIFAGAGVSAAAALILMFFIFHVDYTAAENLQFEDDTYVYYVKAIPKISVPKREHEVRTFTDEDSKELEKKLEDSLKNL